MKSTIDIIYLFFSYIIISGKIRFLFFFVRRDYGVSLRAKFPVSLSNHVGFTP